MTDTKTKRRRHWPSILTCAAFALATGCSVEDIEDDAADEGTSEAIDSPDDDAGTDEPRSYVGVCELPCRRAYDACAGECPNCFENTSPDPACVEQAYQCFQWCDQAMNECVETHCQSQNSCYQQWWGCSEHADCCDGLLCHPQWYVCLSAYLP